MNKHLIKPERIIEILSVRGYSVVHKTKKKMAFALAGYPLLYVNLTSREGASSLILHPDQHTRLETFNAIEGVSISAAPYHSSNLRLFPKRQHKGDNEIGYGLPAEFSSDAALVRFLSAHEGKIVVPAPTAESIYSDEPTTRAIEVQARIGQDVFRASLLHYWRSCAVTSLENPALLRASHIKPWSESNDEERLSHFNGLLLAAHIDAAFDAGLISFDETGKILLSPRLSLNDQQRLQLTPLLRLQKIDEQHKPYLAHHRKNIFKAG